MLMAQLEQLAAPGADGSDGAPGAPGMDGADGTSDGVVTGGSVAGTDLTLERSIGADIVIPGLPTGGGSGSDDGVVDTAASCGKQRRSHAHAWPYWDAR